MKDLLTPRFEVVADYPESKFNVNDILTWQCKTNNIDRFGTYQDNILKTYSISELEKYPHIFKKLEWWKKRTENEMPRFLKCMQFKEVYKIEYWYMDFPIAKVEGENTGCNFAYRDVENTYFPATEKEYTDYINSL